MDRPNPKIYFHSAVIRINFSQGSNVQLCTTCYMVWSAPKSSVVHDTDSTVACQSYASACESHDVMKRVNKIMQRGAPKRYPLEKGTYLYSNGLWGSKGGTDTRTGHVIKTRESLRGYVLYEVNICTCKNVFSQDLTGWQTYLPPTCKNRRYMGWNTSAASSSTPQWSKGPSGSRLSHYRGLPRGSWFHL